MLKVLQITSIDRLSVSELSEAVRVSCGSFDQRKREGRISSGSASGSGLCVSLAAAPLPDIASCPRLREGTGKCVASRERERTTDITVVQ